MEAKKISMSGKFSRAFTALSVSLIFPVLLSAQTPKKANTWYFGDKAGLDFSSGTPTALTNGALQSFEGSAVSSDINGNLLFYSNGGSTPYQGAIWNRNHQMMPNGNLTGAGGCNSSFQSSLILQLPRSESKHYMFTTDCMENSAIGGLRYNVIDMNLDGGLGDVVVKGIPLTSNVDESLTAIQHDNGQDYWVVSHKLHTDSFYVYHLSPRGIVGVVKSKIGNVTPDYAGALVASSNGDKLVHAGMSFTSLFNFNKKTGKISNHKDLNTPGYSAAFSPDCKLVYVADGVGKNIFQFEVNAARVVDTKTFIGATASTGVGAMQLGPDGKIYVARFVSSTSLGVILEPNRKGNRAGYVDNGINLAGKIGKGGLPNFPNNYVGECAASPVENTSNYGSLQVQLQTLLANGLTIGWNPNQPGIFQVLYREAGSNEWNSFETKENTALLENLKEETDYEVMVMPKEELSTDYVAMTNHLAADIDGDAGTEIISTSQVFRTVSRDRIALSPNPAASNLRVDMPVGRGITTNFYIKVSDLSGNQLYAESVLGVSNSLVQDIDVSNLADGMYVLSVSIEGRNGSLKTTSKRFIVAH